jgi:membrane protein implicated in regulation of membrane protease activity
MPTCKLIALLFVFSLLLPACNSVDGGSKRAAYEQEARGEKRATTQQSVTEGGQERRDTDTGSSRKASGPTTQQTQEIRFSIVDAARGFSAFMEAASRFQAQGSTSEAVRGPSTRTASTQPSVMVASTAAVEGPTTRSTKTETEERPSASGTGSMPTLGANGAIGWQEPDWSRKTGSWLFPVLGVVLIAGGIVYGRLMADLRTGAALAVAGLIVCLLPVIGFWLGSIICAAAAVLAFVFVHGFLSSQHTASIRADAAAHEEAARAATARGDVARAQAEQAAADAIYKALEPKYAAERKAAGSIFAEAQALADRLTRSTPSK